MKKLFGGRLVVKGQSKLRGGLASTPSLQSIGINKTDNEVETNN
jgi:hypothetical protein